MTKPTEEEIEAAINAINKMVFAIYTRGERNGKKIWGKVRGEDWHEANKGFDAIEDNKDIAKAALGEEDGSN